VPRKLRGRQAQLVQGGPAGTSQTSIMRLYDTAFKYYRFGDASVMAMFVFVTLMVVTLLQWRFLRKPVEY
jgi:ABC-type sugar transport system permease subunit